MLDFRNQRLAFIKNDYVSLLLRDVLHWFPRELLLFWYFLIFEQTTLQAYIDIIRMTPLMLRKRSAIMNARKVSVDDIKKWII